MIRVLIRCPVTDRDIPTGIVVDDVPEARRLIPGSGIVACDDCGRRHTWWRSEILLEGRRQRRTRREVA